MKKLSLLLALAALVFAGLASAAAVVTSLDGTVQAQSGTAPARALRKGDELAQGDTVTTGARSSVVLKFDDGQVAALSANSRMQITTYAYNANTGTGSVLLSLVVGGMRAITGLIGHNQPANVNFRAATATIGIRGSDGNMVTDGDRVAVTMNDGTFVFQFAGRSVEITAGNGAFGADGRITTGTVQEIFNKLPPEFQQRIGDLQALADLINTSGPGLPRPDGGPGHFVTPINTVPGTTTGGGGPSTQ